MRGDGKDSLRLDHLFHRTVKRAFERHPPKGLYHYTSWEGALGILSSRQFWATAHDCTNDPGELVSADSVILDIARSLAGRWSGPALRTLMSFIDRYEALKISSFVPTFLVSFSALKDDRSQWCRYGDGGRGVCLGLPVLNERMPDQVGRDDAMLRVSYSESSWRPKLVTTFERVLSVINRHGTSADAEVLGYRALLRIAAAYAICAKTPDWKGEQEYRWVALVHGASGIQTLTRERAGKPVRYLPTFVRNPNEKIFLATVTAGPNNDPRESHDRLHQLLIAAGYNRTDPEWPSIESSEVAPCADDSRGA